MVYVYVLKQKNKKLYVGSTINLRLRIKQHETGKVTATKPHLPLYLVYYEAYVEEKDARMREKYLKTGDGKRALKRQLKYYLLKHP